MNSQSNIMPNNYELTQHSTRTIITFFENIVEVEDGWEFETFEIGVPTCGTDYVEEHYEELLTLAKAEEKPSQPTVSIEEEVRQNRADIDYLLMFAE